MNAVTIPDFDGVWVVLGIAAHWLTVPFAYVGVSPLARSTRPVRLTSVPLKSETVTVGLAVLLGIPCALLVRSIAAGRLSGNA